MKKLNEEQQKEIEQIKDWSLLILDYIGKFSQPGIPSFHTEMAVISQETFEKGDLRGMRVLFKDIKEWAKGLSKVQYDELNEQLRMRFGKDLKKARLD